MLATWNDDKLMQYMPMVEKAARNVKVRSYEYEYEDLVSIGFIGLMDAMEKYDESKNVPFENYAYIRVKGSIIDEIRKNGKVPRSQIQRLNEYYKTKELLEGELMRTPTEAEICEKMGITDKQLAGIHQTVLALSNTSLNELLFQDDSEGLSRLDMVEDEEAVSSLDKMLDEEEKNYLHEAIKQLSERDQLVLQLYYTEELQLKEIAHIIDVSIPRVSQINSEIIIKLRDYIQKAMQGG